MKKIYMIPAFIVILIGIVSAFIILPNGYLLEKDEMANVNNETIATYMLNTFKIADYKIMEDKIIIYYNITYVEPKNNGDEIQYKVFTQMKPFIIEKSLWNTCVNITTPETCIEVLVNYPEPFEYSITVNETITITSTYFQALKEQERQYYRAVKIRDNAIDNELDYLFGRITTDD